MNLILKLKPWHLFLIFVLPSYLIRPLGLVNIVVFELIVYSLWIYSIAALCYARNHDHLPVVFILSSILLPLLWIVSYLSIPVISFVASVLWVLALACSIFIATKSFRTIHSGIRSIWIALGFLIPIIGVWYIQTVVNQQQNEVPG